MAVRYAVNSSLWSSGATWDNGSVPLSGDTIYANGFSVTIDTDINVDSLNNNTPPFYLPNMNIPAMTSNSFPSGIVDASGNVSNAYRAFDQITTTYWTSSINNTGWVSYDFGTNKLIKRYYISSQNLANLTFPIAWIFEGWNTTTNSWDPLESKSAMGFTINSGYLSPILTHTAQYSNYRLNILTPYNVGYPPILNRFEMTENTGTTYGIGTSGSFTVPASLVGTRNITFSGNGIVTNGTNTVLTVASLSGNTVNFNITSGGYIINRFYRGSITMGSGAINITGTASVNFNADLWGNQTANNSYNSGGAVGINAAATVTVNGNIYADKGSDGALTYWAPVLLMNAANCVVNVIGNVYGSDYKAYGTPIVSTAVNTLNITGDVISNISYGIYTYTTAIYLNIVGNVTYTNASSWSPIFIYGASIVNITGNITAPPSFAAINCNTGAATVNVPTGTITAGINGIGISAPNATLVTVAGPLINTNTVPAVLTNKMRFYSGQTAQLTVQDTTNANITLSSIGTSGVTIGLPFSGDVRYLTTYGQNNEYVGSLRVPSVDNVRKGVQTDFTVGTADLTANDIFSAITTSSNSVAVRLRNVSTVQSAGDQIASLS